MNLINSSKRVVFLVSFVDILAVSAIAPLINVHLHASGYSNFASGFVAALYPCAQFIFSPIVGHYSDLYGRKTLLQYCLLVCGVCYGVLGLFDHLLWILTVRSIVGIAKHTQLICKAILEDKYPGSFHSDYGKLNGYTAIGFIIGPVIGGHLIDRNDGFYYLSIITGLLFILNSLIVYRYLDDESDDDDRRKYRKFDLKSRTIFSDMKQIEWANCWDVFLLKFITTFAVLSFLTNFTLCVKEKFHLDSVFVGYIHSFRGLIGACTGLTINTWSGKFIPPSWNNYQKLKAAFILLAVTSVLQYFTDNICVFLVSLIPFGVAGICIRIYSNELLFEKTGDLNRGLLLGNFNNVSSVARFAMPVFVGAFLDAYGYDSIYLLSFFGYLCSIAVAQCREKSIKISPRSKTD